MAEKEDEECRKRRNRWHRRAMETGGWRTAIGKVKKLEECVELVLPSMRSHIIRTFTFLKIRHLAPAISTRHAQMALPAKPVWMTWNARQDSRISSTEAREGYILFRAEVWEIINETGIVEWRDVSHTGCTIAFGLIRSISGNKGMIINNV